MRMSHSGLRRYIVAEPKEPFLHRQDARELALLGLAIASIALLLAVWLSLG